MSISVWANLWLRDSFCDWQRNKPCKVFKPQSCQTTGHKYHWWSSSHPHCIRKICPYYLSGRLRIVWVSPLTLRSLQIWLNKAIKFYLFVLHILPLRNWSFLSKSLFWLSLTVSSANCPMKTKILLWSGEATWQWTLTTTNQHNSQSINPDISEQRMYRIFFLVPMFKLKNLFWQKTSGRFAQAGILLWVTGKQTGRSKALWFYDRILAN